MRQRIMRSNGTRGTQKWKSHRSWFSCRGGRREVPRRSGESLADFRDPPEICGSPSSLDFDFKNRFDLDRDSAGQRIGSQRTACRHTGFFAENVAKQFAATVDHGGLLVETI
ncbi:hypothetical protein Pla52o_30550 [Novipirellula galeiformis]|uniref:Uncharacterized protein n=1 Tax=Novipirellula galeiformis TaxID=2528004 RepID=A0A5C6CE17_9BACT|nr:hypothetical protein Pla52o_30550 [Novipirellula galeiformis]